MKILHIVKQFNPMIGGLENYVSNLTEQQITNGHVVTVLTLNRSFVSNEKLNKFERLDNGVEVHRIPFFFSKKYPIALKAYSHLKDHDVINVHAVDFFADYISLTKIFHKKKIILTTHGGFFHTRWGYFFKKIYFHTITRLIIRSYDAVIACSDNDVEVFKKIVPEIIKVNNGVNIKPYLSVAKSPKGKNLLYVGRIDIHKRVDNLIRLVSALNNKGFDTNLTIVGPDWKHLMPKLTKLVDDLKIRDRITFAGPVSDKDLIKYYSESYFFVSASEYEGFGISAIEALASGTLCALNDIVSFRSILNNHQFGLVCDFSNIEGTADQIIEFEKKIGNNYLKLSNEARETIKKYNWESVAKTVFEIYEQN